MCTGAHVELRTGARDEPRPGAHVAHRKAHRAGAPVEMRTGAHAAHWKARRVGARRSSAPERALINTPERAQSGTQKYTSDGAGAHIERSRSARQAAQKRTLSGAGARAEQSARGGSTSTSRWMDPNKGNREKERHPATQDITARTAGRDEIPEGSIRSDLRPSRRTVGDANRLPKVIHREQA